MHYSVPEAARLLGVSENLVYDWIRNEGLPATLFGGRYHLNNVKLVDWAHRKQFPLPVDGELVSPVLEEALVRGGVLHDVPGGSLGEAFEHIFRNRVGLEPRASEKVLGMIRTREDLGWSIEQHGIALPNLRAPLVVLPESSRVYIAYLNNGFQGGIPPEAPSVIFVALVSAYPMHLNLLSRCFFSIRDPGFVSALENRAGIEELIRCMRGFKIEQKPSPLRDTDAIDLS